MSRTACPRSLSDRPLLGTGVQPVRLAATAAGVSAIVAIASAISERLECVVEYERSDL
jgi:hypothetical protein